MSRRLIITRFKTGGAMGRQGHAEPRANLNESAIGLTTDLVYPNRSDPARDTLADWLRSQVAAQPSAQFGHIDEVSVGHGDNAPQVLAGVIPSVVLFVAQAIASARARRFA